MNITSICEQIQNVVNKARIAIPTIPAVFLICSVNRTGLSKKSISSKIIADFTKYGIPNEPNPDGSPNLYAALVKDIVDNVVDEIKLNGRVQGVILPGSFSTIGYGANAAGPVVVKSTSILPIKIEGIFG